MSEIVRPSEALTEEEPFYTIHKPWCDGAVHRKGGKPFAADLIYAHQYTPLPGFTFNIGVVADGATLVTPIDEIPVNIKEEFACEVNGELCFLPDVYWAAMYHLLL